MEILLVVGAIIFFIVGMSSYAPAIKNNLDPGSTVEERRETNEKANNFDIILIMILVFGLITLTGIFSTGISVDHFMDNMNYIGTGVR